MKRDRCSIVREIDKDIMSTSYDRDTDFVYSGGKGVYLFDCHGRKFLDFAAGISVMNAGHSNPQVMSAIRKQLSLGTHAAFPDFYAETPVMFSQTLLSLLPSPLNRVFLSNSGTESVECAIKLAKWHSRKKWLVAFSPCFHGRTMGSLSMTDSKPVQREGFAPFLPVKHVPYPYPYRFNGSEEECSNASLSAVENVFKKLDGNIAGVFFEPISGEGGYIVPPKNFARALRKLCSEFGVLLCADEVQSGCFRTGKFLAISNFGVKPDILCMSKSIGGGLPLGATVASRKIMNWPHGAHSNTFGGNLLACAAGKAALEFMERKNLAKNAERVGKSMLKRLSEMKEDIEIVGDVRGMGLMIGVEIVESKKSKKPGHGKREEILKKCFEKGLLMLACGNNVLRLCPPLVLTENEAMKGLDLIESALKEVE
ncbi:MAG: aminotransferase class III-fold pyridoxal phosphate-dependent enzyme [Candidatus Diapherotrites archaeon]|nr:aminotransferase class III-fold pyridoxal phosphate-dependent enzyme [Candidatus Diapherotrites archaeon]